MHHVPSMMGITTLNAMPISTKENCDALLTACDKAVSLIISLLSPISVWTVWLQQLKCMAGCLKDNAVKGRLFLLLAWPNDSVPFNPFPLRNWERHCAVEKLCCAWWILPVSVTCAGWCSIGRTKDQRMPSGNSAVYCGILNRSVLAL